LEHRSNSGCSRDSVQSGDQAAHLGPFAVGPDSELGQRPKIAYKTINNAGAETIDTAPSYRQAFKKRRCLVPADGFFEWRKVPGGKIPYSIGMKDDSPFVFAGLWEGWKDPANDEWLPTCTIITSEPNEIVREIHTRMPVILQEEHHDSWLSGEAGSRSTQKESHVIQKSMEQLGQTYISHSVETYEENKKRFQYLTDQTGDPDMVRV
jgi:putative SOS response-associated peptidase YedK